MKIIRMRRARALVGWLLILMLSGCSKGPDAPQVSPTPAPTPTPIVELISQLPSPSVDPSFPSIDDTLALPFGSLPVSVRMRFTTPDGSILQVQGDLATGDGFSLYLPKHLSDPSLEGFIMQRAEDGSYIRPDRPADQDTGEWLRVQCIPNQDAIAALEATIASMSGDFIFISRHNALAWESDNHFQSDPLLGSMPLDGEFAIMERIGDEDLTTVRLFSMQHGQDTFLLTMRTQEERLPTSMYYFFASMMASLRFG